MSDETLVALGGGNWRDGKEDTGAADTEDSSALEAESESQEVYGPGDEEAALDTDGLSPVDIRNFSVKCGYCGNYQVIVRFRQIDEDWNEYTYECDEPPCSSDIERSRTVLEIPSALDQFSRRDPDWHGGEVHAGAKYEPES